MLSILIPVRNEGLNIKIMLKILKAVVEVPHEVLVIHDHPEDSTIPVVQDLTGSYPHLRLIHNDSGCGVINALKKGVEAARGEFVLIFAADEIGPVLAIEEMLSLASQGCDFISCTRYAHGGRRLGGSIVGGILSRTANYLFHLITRSVLTDSTTGIKMFRRSLFLSWDLESRSVGWAIAFELSIKAQTSGVLLGEVPIISIDRLYGGKSSFRLGPWVVEYFKWFVRGTIALWKAKSQSKVVVKNSEYFQKDAA